MTAQHPQSSLEWLQQLYRAHQERLHTPPVFPPTIDQTALAAQAEELRRWQLEERYGPPLHPYWYKAALVWGLVVAGADTLLILSGVFLSDPSHGEMDWPLLLGFYGFAGVMFLLSFSCRIASSPDRFYGSRLVRAWTGTLRFVGTVVFTMWALDKLDPPQQQAPPAEHPYPQYGGAMTTNAYGQPAVRVQVVDSYGMNVPQGTPGSTFRPF